MTYCHQLKKSYRKRNNAQVSVDDVNIEESLSILEDTKEFPESKGDVTAVLAKVRAEKSNILVCITSVTPTSKFYSTVALTVIFGSMKREHPCTILLD